MQRKGCSCLWLHLIANLQKNPDKSGKRHGDVFPFADYSEGFSCHKRVVKPLFLLGGATLSLILLNFPPRVQFVLLSASKAVQGVALPLMQHLRFQAGRLL